VQSPFAEVTVVEPPFPELLVVTELLLLPSPE